MARSGPPRASARDSSTRRTSASRCPTSASPSCCTRRACRSPGEPWPSIANSCRSCPPGCAGAWREAPYRRRRTPGGARESSVQIVLTARHCELDPELRAFTQQRLEKLQRYDGDIREVRVIVSQERRLHTAEITLRAHQQDVVITESHAAARDGSARDTERLEDAGARVEGEG